MIERAVLPPQNILYMLLTVGELKKVQGRLKLFKLQHLLQTEAKLKFDKPDNEDKWGYTDYGTLAFCIEKDLIKESVTPTGFDEPRRDYELGGDGIQLYEIIKSKINQKDMKKIRGVLCQYSSKTGYELMEYTHKNYIDEFVLSKVNEMSRVHIGRINEIQDVMQQLVDKNQDCDMYLMIGKLDHIKRILNALQSKAPKKMQVGTLISSIKELEVNLANSAYKPNDAIDDIFSFIEHYAEKEKIMESMAATDLSTLPEEEQKCLSKFLNQVKPLLSS